MCVYFEHVICTCRGLPTKNPACKTFIEQRGHFNSWNSCWWNKYQVCFLSILKTHWSKLCSYTPPKTTTTKTNTQNKQTKNHLRCQENGRSRLHPDESFPETSKREENWQTCRAQMESRNCFKTGLSLSCKILNELKRLCKVPSMALKQGVGKCFLPE